MNSMKPEPFGADSARERGGAMVMTVVLIVGLASLSMCMLALTSSSMDEQRTAKAEISSQLVAEAGLSAAYFDLSNGGTGQAGSAGQPVAYGGASYWVTAAAGAPGFMTLTSTGDGSRSRSRIELMLHQVSTAFFTYAAFGDTGLEMDSNAFADSYDSDLGSYASQVTGGGNTAHALENGNVGSNQNAHLDSNVKVFGDVIPGPGYTATVTGNAQVTGSTTPAPAPQPMPPIALPAIPATGPLTGNNQTLPAGQYHFTSLEINSSKTLTVTGPATIVADSFWCKSNSKFIVDPTGGPVELYVVNDFVLDSNALMYATDYKPKNLSIKLLTDNIQNPDVVIQLDDAVFDSNTKLWGTIYAPNAAIEIDSNFELFGAIVASSVDLDSNSKVHFDEALLDVTDAGPPAWERVCWRQLE